MKQVREKGKESFSLDNSAPYVERNGSMFHRA